MRRSAFIWLLLASCCLNLKKEKKEEHELDFPPGPVLTVSASAAGVTMRPSEDSLAHMSVKGGLKEAEGKYEISGAGAEMFVPSGTAVVLDAVLAGIEGVAPDSAIVDATLSGVDLEGWKAGKLNLFMSGGSVVLAPDARSFSAFVKWSGLELYVPEGVFIKLEADTSGAGFEIEEGIISEQGIPVSIEARGAGVEIKRWKPGTKRKVNIGVKVKRGEDSSGKAE
ncbi:MAG: hypothetical protein ABIM88_02050 [candidate division WOR-3 bacterium]